MIQRRVICGVWISKYAEIASLTRDLDAANTFDREIESDVRKVSISEDVRGAGERAIIGGEQQVAAALFLLSLI